MLDSTIVTLTSDALVVATKVVAPLLVVSLAVGLVVSLLQAVFQVQDQVLAMVPRLAACGLVLLLTGSWMLRSLVDYTTTLFTSIPRIVGLTGVPPPSGVLGLPLSTHTLDLFLLVLARTTAWATTVPLFTPRGIPAVAKLAVALSLALFLTPLMPQAPVPEGTGPFVLAVVAQVAIGLAIGLLSALVLAAVEVAGSFADYASGFSYGAILDPVNGAQSAAFARLTSVTFMALLFATEGYQSLFSGFLVSFRALPVDHVPSLAAGAGPLLGAAVSGVFVAALQIGAPLLGVLFLTEVALALAGKFVPQANAMTVGLPIKSLVALTAAGTMLALLPGRIPALVDPAVRLGGQVLR